MVGPVPQYAPLYLRDTCLEAKYDFDLVAVSAKPYWLNISHMSHTPTSCMVYAPMLPFLGKQGQNVILGLIF